MYARLPGDASALGSGFAVLRSKTLLAGPMGFLSTADDKDKANVPWLLLAAVVFVAAFVGIALTALEHSAPLNELVMQADRLKTGVMDGLQVARFRGAYRLAAQSLNQGMERAIEKAGGVTRKPADLESILGPAPAQPSMSAFSFPLADGAAIPVVPPAAPVPPVAPAPAVAATPAAPALSLPRPVTSGLSKETPPVIVPTVPSGAGRAPPPPAAKFQPVPAAGRPAVVPVPAAPPFAAKAPPPVALSPEDDDDGDDEATMVGAVPAELLAQATGESRAASEESAEWLSVYEDFLRTKKQCGELTDGLSFEKFANTLKKNRDALIQRHGCKRVKFSVYVKEGRASLKATPVRE